MDTPVIAVGILGVAALGGATLATFHLRSGSAPKALAYGHGAIAATGVGTLAGAVIQGTATGLACWSLALFALAAAGGLTLLFAFRLRERPIPPAFIVGHGLIAATAYVLLCLGVLGRPDRDRALGAVPERAPIAQPAEAHARR